MTATIHPCDSQSLTPARTLLELLLCLAIGLSYVPQYIKIVRQGSSSGIASWYIVLLCLFSTTQLAIRLESQRTQSAFECVRSGSLSPWKAFSALLVYLQITVLWICTAILLVLYLKHRENLPIDDLGLRNSVSSEPATLSTKAILAITITHAFVFLSISLWILIGGEPVEDADSWVYLIFQAFLHVFLAFLGLLIVLALAVPQIYFLLATNRVGSLSLVTVGLLVVVFAALGASQALRLSWQQPFKVKEFFRVSIAEDGVALGCCLAALSHALFLIVFAVYRPGRSQEEYFLLKSR